MPNLWEYNLIDNSEEYFFAHAKLHVCFWTQMLCINKAGLAPF